VGRVTAAVLAIDGGNNQRVGSRAVRSSPTLLADFQRILLSIGVQLHWREEIQTKVR
jgi:hypothetical protein